MPSGGSHRPAYRVSKGDGGHRSGVRMKCRLQLSRYPACKSTLAIKYKVKDGIPGKLVVDCLLGLDEQLKGLYLVSSYCFLIDKSLFH